jgi:hypothetical protein
MEMHGALRLAGGAGGEADQAHVVGGRLHGPELGRGPGDERLETVRRARSPIDHVAQVGRQRPRPLHLVAQAMVAERESDLRLGDRIGDLAGPQQGHGGHHHPARLQDREVDGDHRRVVGGAQENPVARHEAEPAHEQVADPVHPLLQLAVGQGLVGADEAGLVAPARLHPPVEEFRRAVDALRVLQLRPAEDEVRPLVPGRKVLSREGIHMSRIGHRPFLCCAPWAERGGIGHGD